MARIVQVARAVMSRDGFWDRWEQEYDDARAEFWRKMPDRNVDWSAFMEVAKAARIERRFGYLRVSLLPAYESGTPSAVHVVAAVVGLDDSGVEMAAEQYAMKRDGWRGAVMWCLRNLDEQCALRERGTVGAS